MNNRINKGFTLAEMLVVIAIIALMAAAAYVIIKPAENKGNVESTKATIELLCAAIEQYHNFYNEFPDPNGNLISPGSGYYPNDIPTLDPNNAEKLSYRLSLCPDAVAILNQIDSKMVKNADKNVDDILEYIDAWGMEFRYEYDKEEEWNFPLITSAGPDKKFGDATNPDDPDIADNITSRK